MYVDGAKATPVGLYASTGQPCEVVFRKEWVSSGRHALKVRMAGSKNASSSGTRHIDAFAIVC